MTEAWVSGMDVCACGHWRADHIGKDGPCAASKRHWWGIGPDLTCKCDRFRTEPPKPPKGAA